MKHSLNPGKRAPLAHWPPLRLGWAATLALVAGCTVGPDYHRPGVNVPAVYRALPGWQIAKPNATGPKENWWVDFHDPLLDELEPLVSVSNQTVRQDYYNYQQALALVREARAGLFPTISASGSATRARASGAGTTTITNAGTAQANVSWAPDLWGQVRRTVEEREASAQVSAATVANATLSEQVALATAVINLRIADANAALLSATVKAYSDYLRVVADQDRAGTIAPSDLVAARTQLESAKSSLIAIGVSRAQYAHAIAVLVGRNPEDLDIPTSTSLPALPDVPAGVPSTLLERRPDIAAAERQMAEANAAIGVAVSAYYPTLSLSGALGFTQSPLAGLLHAANYVWSLGAGATETLFDGGERSAEVASAKAAYDAAVANYRGTVLAAFQGVENDLSNLRILAEQAQVVKQAVADAKHGTQIAQNEYEAGTVDYTTVATAQTTQLGLQETELTVLQERLVSAAALCGDLGGGWSAAQLDKPLPALPHTAQGG